MLLVVIHEQPSGCRHQFCRECLVTWAAQKSECPLCKSEFRAIFSGKNFSQREEIKVPEVPEWLRQLEREASEEHIEVCKNWSWFILLFCKLGTMATNLARRGPCRTTEANERVASSASRTIATTPTSTRGAMCRKYYANDQSQKKYLSRKSALSFQS